MFATDQALLGYCRLQLNIDTPDLEDTWLEGYEQGCAEYAESNNPFPKNSVEYHHWQDGWWAGFYNEPALFDFSGQVLPTVNKSHLGLEQRILANTAGIERVAPPITAKQWLLVTAEIFSGIIVFFAAFQLADMAL